MKQSMKLVGYSRDLRTNMTEAEKTLWYRLRRRQLDGAHFRRQHPIAPYIVDFACFDAKLVVELDGGQHCDSNYDVKRDTVLANKGWRVLRFWNTQITENMDGVLATIVDALHTSPASTLFPAQSAEGE